MRVIRRCSIVLVGSVFLLSACASLVAVDGQRINCDDYVSRYANINVDLSKIKAFQLAIGLSFEQVSKFEKLQGDYILEARRLCQNAPLYFEHPPEGPREWRCRDERLSRSLEQLRVITSAFDALKTEKEAQANAEVIRQIVDHYFITFMSDRACSAPPPIKQLDEIKASLDLLDERLNTIIKQEIVTYKETLPFDITGLLTSVIKGVGIAFGSRAKTDLLLSEFYYRESSWALESPGTALTLLGSTDLDRRLTRYAVQSVQGEQSLRTDATRLLLQLRALSLDNTSFRKTLYDALVVSGAEEKRRLVTEAIDALEQEAAINKTVSLCNLLGTLSMAIGERERALKFYYEGYLLDKEHIPIYESISYALWRLNGDSYTARQYAEEGLRLATELRVRVKDLRQKSLDNLTKLSTQAERNSVTIQRYVAEVSLFFRESGPAIEEYLDEMYDRLATGTAYFNAIEVKNKEESERLAQEVLDRTPENQNDSDYLDLYGFVRLRFSQDMAGIDEALAYFTRALRTAQTQEQRDLAGRHIALASRTKELRSVLAKRLDLE